jgi:hypothetical protein
MREGLRRCAQPSAGKAKVVVVKQTLTVHTSFWRWSLPARAPTGGVNGKNGNEAMVDINDSNNGHPLKMFIVRVAALSWAATQVPEITAAIQSFLNAGFRSATHVEFAVIVGDGVIHAVTNEVVFESFRNFGSKLHNRNESGAKSSGGQSALADWCPTSRRFSHFRRLMASRSSRSWAVRPSATLY